MIQLTHVHKSFNNGKPVVNDVSFEVHPGEIMILLGTSGSGKTTTLRMINQLIIPDSGSILVNGVAVTEQRPETLRRNIGYVLQDNGLFPHYTVSENIGIVPTLLKWDKKRITTRTHDLMEQLHLPVQDYYHAYPQALSGGQQQRVGLARALAADPPILLMDEPFGALDPITRSSVRKEFRSLDEINNKTVIIVTHDVLEAFELGTHICLMDKGSIQQIGTPAAMLFTPANDFVRSFFQEQQLLLELKAVSLAHILPYLTNIAVSQQTTPLLTADNSCWEALELLTTNTTPISILAGNQIIPLDISAFMQAITQYKQTVSTHGRSTGLS
jgi:osmoprotectant transport system ATP-binding protein